MASLVEWFDGKSIGVQLLVLAAVLDPLGIVLGALAGPAFLGTDVVTGAAAGLVVASVPLTAVILRNAGEFE